jgi:hypothetical protein
VILVAALAVGGCAWTVAGCGGSHHHASSSTTGSTPAATSTSSAATSTSSVAPAPPAQQPPAQPAPSSPVFGISINRLFNDGTYSLAQINLQLAALQRTGVRFARSDALWERAEPAAPRAGVHHYDWAYNDLTAAELATHGIQWLPIIDYTAFWDESVPGYDHSPPRSTANFAAYAAAFASRYGTGGSFWRTHPSVPAHPVSTYEIWNEPDGPGFWIPGPQPDRYADLYLAARAAITATQPDARVVVGGLTQPVTFLPAMVSARPQLRGHLDGVAIHPYARPAAMLAKIRADRRTLISLGLGSVPLYVTEFGWSTSPPTSMNYASPTVRAEYIRRAFADLGHLRCGVAAAILYTWVTPQINPGDLEDWYGIHPPGNGSGNDPATPAFADGLRLASAASGPRLAPCPGG